MDEQKIRAAVEAAVRAAFPTDTTVWDDAGIGVAVDEIMFQVREHAQEEYTRGLADGRLQEREVYFG